jgi:hypothetical protein
VFTGCATNEERKRAKTARIGFRLTFAAFVVIAVSLALGNYTRERVSWSNPAVAYEGHGVCITRAVHCGTRGGLGSGETRGARGADDCVES